jgi:hypothetical protein
VPAKFLSSAIFLTHRWCGAAAQPAVAGWVLTYYGLVPDALANFNPAEILNHDSSVLQLYVWLGRYLMQGEKKEEFSTTNGHTKTDMEREE